jgi:hypothetical protein
MSRFSKLWIAVAALAVTALAMVAANHLAASFFAVARAKAWNPVISGSFAEFLSIGISIGVMFFVIGVGVVAARARGRRNALVRVDRWAQLRSEHTQLAKRILPPDEV